MLPSSLGVPLGVMYVTYDTIHYYTRSYDQARIYRALTHSLTQSCDRISCHGKPVERTNEIGLEIVSLVYVT